MEVYRYVKKTITGEDGKTYNVKEKKAWYKKWWVWIIAIILIIIIGGALGSGMILQAITTHLLQNPVLNHL
ncbi:hypothetical protein ABHW52_07765 [Pediococcus pentosaceus]